MTKTIALVYNYLLDNKIMSAVVLYFILSSIFKLITTIDICIPCLWKTIFGFNCPSCGLTHSFINIIQLNFKGAFESNCLIFILIPFGFYYVLNDFFKFKAKYAS